MKRLRKTGCKEVFLHFDSLVLPFLPSELLKKLVDTLILAFRQVIRQAVSFRCPVCLNDHLWKNGHEARKFAPPVQRYICPICGKHCCENTFSPFYYYKYPAFLILSCLKLKQDGRAVTEINAKILLIYMLQRAITFFQPCYHTIVRWIRKFGQLAINGSHTYKLQAKRWKPWQMDEMYSSRVLPAEPGKYVKDGKKQIGRVGVKDPTTQLCFMESTKQQDNKTLNTIFSRAKTRFSQTPRTAVTDGHLGYKPLFENSTTNHKVVIHKYEFVNQHGYHTNHIENHWSQIRAVERPARGYKKFETHQFYTKFMEMTWNFFRQNQAINSFTPAQKAGVKDSISLLGLILKT